MINLPIYKGGWPWIGAAAGLSIGLMQRAWARHSLILIVSSVLCAVLAFLLAWFFRDPEREPNPKDLALMGHKNPILAPADGLVTDIAAKNGFLKVGIFMSPLDNHIQRNPLEGRVLEVTRSGSRRLAAFDPRATDLNVSATTAMMHEQLGVFRVRQITGMLARRILTWAQKGSHLKRGERLGMILLGSRVELELPEQKVTLLIKMKDRLVAGKTIIGFYT